MTIETLTGEQIKREHSKTFYHLLVNTVVANVTNMTVWFALIFFVYLETRSVMATSIVTGIFLTTVAFTGFWFGNLIDHHKKKNLMLLSGLISMAIYAVGLVVYLTAPAGAFNDPASLRLWVFVPLLLAGVIAGNIRGIALPTLITVLVPEDVRDKANGLVGAATGVTILITSAISGFLVGLAGMLWVLILGVVLMAVSLGHLWVMTIPESTSASTRDGKPARLDIRGTLAVVGAIPGLFALILFTTINNFLGGVFMGLMDAYGLSLVSVEVWGVLWAVLSCGFIIGGLIIARFGLGKNPLAAMFAANLVIWAISSVFTIQSSIVLLSVGMFIYITVIPYIEAAEHTIVQKVVPEERQGRVFGFAQSVEMAASPLTTFLIGPIAELIFIPFMTTGTGTDLIGGWFGTGADRGIALVFTLTGIVGLILTLIARNTRYYRQLATQYIRR